MAQLKSPRNSGPKDTSELLASAEKAQVSPIIEVDPEKEVRAAIEAVVGLANLPAAAEKMTEALWAAAPNIVVQAYEAGESNAISRIYKALIIVGTAFASGYRAGQSTPVQGLAQERQASKAADREEARQIWASMPAASSGEKIARICEELLVSRATAYTLLRD